VDALYIGRADNGSGHVVFKLSTKQPVSVNRVTVITPTADHIKFVNDMAEAENQPEGLDFADINGKVTLEGFIDGIVDDDDSNASDDDFVHGEEYQKKCNEEARHEKNEGLAIDENHAAAFSNDLEQLVQDPSDRPGLRNTRLRPHNNSRAVTLSHETKECGNKKKKKVIVRFDPKLGVDDKETSLYDALSDHQSEEETTNPDSTDSDPDPVPNSGVGMGDDDDPNSVVEKDDDDGLQPDLDCSLNPDGYWGTNAHSTCSYVMNTIASCTNFEASKSTPQYGFNRGMKESGELGFEATMKELDDNLIGMGAV
jgi:hypothetical protein